MLSPDHRYLRALQTVELGGSCEEELAPLVKILEDKDAGVPLIEDDLSRAVDIYLSKRQSKYLMEALLIAPDGTIDRITEVMRCKKEMVEHYKKFFFDTSVFVDGFDLADYVSELTDDKSRITKKQALTHGFAFIVSNFTGKDLDLSPVEVAKRMQAFAYGMASQARGHAVTSEVAREAKSWLSLVKTFSDVLTKNDEKDHGNFFSDFTVIMGRGTDIKDIEGTPDVVRG